MRRARLLICLAIGTLTSICQAAEQITYPFQGVTLIHRTETSPRNLDIHVAIIDMLAPGIRFYATPESPHANDAVVAQTTRNFIAQAGAQIGINGDFYSSAGSINGLVHRNPSNFAASLGNIYSTFASGRPAFHIAENNVAHTVTGSAGSTTPNPSVPVWNAVGGSDYLVNNGNIPAYMFDPLHSRYAFANELHPRTAIGVSADRTKVAMFVVDGRQSHSGGMNFPEMANMLRNDYGMQWAINLDGGGSTTMAMADPVPRTLNRPSDGTDRSVANSLAVYARPTPPPIPASAHATTYQQQLGLYSHTGAQINSSAPTTNSATGGAIRVGYDISVGKSRGVFSFDLADIPSNATIHSVSLTLDAFSATGTTTSRYVDLELFELNDPVSEDQVTWNQATTGNNWAIPGGDFSSQSLSSLFAQNTTGLKTFVSTVDFVAAAQEALIAGEPLDLLVAALDAEAWGASNFGNLNLRFRSDDATVSQRPTLTVHYSPIEGDHNEDGFVDAADYVAWSKGIGGPPLPGDYEEWRANFGEGDSAGLGGTSVVPEPSVAVLFVVAALAVGVGRGAAWPR